MEGIWVAGISGALALYSLYHLARFFLRWRRLQAGRGWSEITGSVIKTSVQSTRGKKSAPPFSGEVTYSYQVMGKTYTGKYGKDTLYRSEAAARQALSAFPAGAPVALRCNPQNPREVVTRQDRVPASEWIQWIVFFILNAAVAIYSGFFW